MAGESGCLAERNRPVRPGPPPAALHEIVGDEMSLIIADEGNRPLLAMA
jgi:hypothetical protein